jgi:hypothetical protein
MAFSANFTIGQPQTTSTTLLMSKSRDKELKPHSLELHMCCCFIARSILEPLDDVEQLQFDFMVWNGGVFCILQASVICR